VCSIGWLVQLAFFFGVLLLLGDLGLPGEAG
jgi:hypothetical protein